MKHLEEAQKTYQQHLRFALRASLLLTWAAFTSLVHGFIPAWFPFVARNIVHKLNNDM